MDNYYRLLNLINDKRHGGQVYVFVDETDCDHVRATSAHVVDATVGAVTRFVDELYYHAEGRVMWDIMSHDEYVDFMPESVDYGARAHEDGHPHFITYD